MNAPGGCTQAMVAFCSVCYREEITPEKLCSFFRGNLPKNPDDWIRNPEWSRWFGHLCRFFEESPENLVVAFLTENRLTDKELVDVLSSFPKCIYVSSYFLPYLKNPDKTTPKPEE